MANASGILVIFAIILFVTLITSSSSVGASGDLQLGWMPTRSTCEGSIAECLAGDEFDMDTEINRRILATRNYISYGVLPFIVVCLFGYGRPCYYTQRILWQLRMELSLRTLHVDCISKAIRDSNTHAYNASDLNFSSPTISKSQKRGRCKSIISSAIPETVASVVIAASVMGAAATFLIRRNKTEKNEVSLICEDCSGSGICSECNGEGFVLKKLSEESAEKARLTARNMATRYTAGLPKKWSYCTKCSAARSCSTCGGRGRLSP